MIGTETITTQGLKAKIIEFNNVNDFKIQFEDGVIKECHNLSDFKKGRIGHPKFSKEYAYVLRMKKKYLGKTNVNTQNLKMTIIDYINSANIKVQFEDGAIVEKTFLSSFKSGKIKNPNCNMRIGESNIAKNGLKMKIIAYRGTNDLDVEFENGEVVKHKAYVNFMSGEIKLPNYFPKSTKRIGEIKTANCGLSMEIIEYNGINDIKVKFEDGMIYEKTRYGAFRNGQIMPKNFTKKGFKYFCENYFNYKVSFAFELNNKKYYIAKNIYSGEEILTTLQEIYQLSR